MLRVEHIRVSYQRVPALHDVSLSLDSGEIVAVVGGNGNGKSTTLRAIAGLNRLDSGQILLGERGIGTLPAHERVRLGISLVPEGRRLFPRLTVEQNLRLGAYTRDDSAEIAETLERVFTLFPVLAARRNQLAATMSGGEQQMLAIGRGLMAQPRLLLLDEPSWGIAPKLVTRILDTDLGYSGSWTYTFAASGEGTLLTITENGEVSNVLFRFMSRYFFSQTATIEAYLTALARRLGAP